MRLLPARKHIPILATVAVTVALYVAAGLKFDGFFSWTVLINFFADNSFLGIVAVGMTFVILSGGIDLSVGAVVGFVSILAGVLMEQKKLPPLVVVPLCLVCGLALGAAMGVLISQFNLPPFLVTLAGMFLARGLGFVTSIESAPITNSFFTSLADYRLNIGPDIAVPFTALAFLAVVLAAAVLAQSTCFGRAVYAVGGNEEAARLMGLPVARTKIGVYALSGLCSAFAGLVYCVYSSSGNPTAGTGMELDAIAAVVIGGTLLSGGVGYVAGTIFGVLILGIIQTAIMFQGTLSSWWTKIAIGLLVLVFILLQRLLSRRTV